MNDEDTRTKLASFVEKLKTEGCAAKAFFVDATDPTAVSHLVAEIEKNIGPIEVAVYNIGAQVGSRYVLMRLFVKLYPRSRIRNFR